MDAPTLLLLGALALTPGAQASADPSATGGPAQEAKQDRYGDPLPPGAIARLGTIRLRHEANMTTGVAFSIDGKWMATATNNAPDINVWNIATGERVHRFTKQQPDDPEQLADAARALP